MKLKLSDDIIFYYENEKLIIDNYMKHEQRVLKSSLLPLISYLSKWRSIEEIYNFYKTINIRDNIEDIINELHACHFLVNEKEYKSIEKSPFDTWGKPTKYFHFNSRTFEKDIGRSALTEFEELSIKNHRIKMPDIYKSIESESVILLPEPLMVHKDFMAVALERQTIRSFDTSKSINIEQLSTILYYVFGATACSLDHGMGKALFKTSPSGGSRHSIEANPIIFNVAGIKNGIYHYSVKNHSLELMKEGDFRELTTRMSGDQPHAGWPAVTLFYTSVLERIEWKYQTARGYKVIYMDVGHLSQMLYLVAGCLGLGAFFAGAMRDELVENTLNLNPKMEVPVGFSGIGVLRTDVEINGRYVRDDIDEMRKLKLAKMKGDNYAKQNFY